MKIFLYFFLVIPILASCTFQPRAEWICTTENFPWEEQSDLFSESADTITSVDIVIHTNKKQQRIEGFGACFNELGWLSLNKLLPEVREEIMEELFFPEIGANFTICRMPIGANDFSRDWYSYDEVANDFSMDYFTIANDLQILIPFIKNAQKYQPDLRIWASPWCPPSWMKYNKHYASAYTGDNYDKKYRNGLTLDKVGKEGTDMFIQDSTYLQAYAFYFSKFIKAYREQSIPIFAVMPQNEFNSAQIFPSCCWTATSLANFVTNYLGPSMDSLGVDVMLGTVERSNATLVDSILDYPNSRKYIKGIGFQWAGKDALPNISKRYSTLKLYQTEQECGNGKNDWEGAVYSWNLLRHYLDNGVSAYMYWNIALDKGGVSRWGWAQNSLIVVDPEMRTFNYTNEYYVMKHVSHYVHPGARRLETSGGYNNLLAFENPDESIAIILANDSEKERTLSIKIGRRVYSPTLKAHSFNSLLIE